jgi:hypothetical protein
MDRTSGQEEHIAQFFFKKFDHRTLPNCHYLVSLMETKKRKAGAEKKGGGGRELSILGQVYCIIYG